MNIPPIVTLPPLVIRRGRMGDTLKIMRVTDSTYKRKSYLISER